MLKRTYLYVPVAISLALLSSYSASVKTEDTTRNNADNLLIVDCLLPGSIRQFGTRLTMLSARRAVRTSGVDCAQRGGEFTPALQATPDTALKVWQSPADAGDAQAQVQVGQNLERKNQVAAANKYYQGAEKQGNKAAQVNRAFIVEKQGNKQEAIRILGNASGLGNGYVTKPPPKAKLAVNTTRAPTKRPATAAKAQNTQQAKQAIAQTKAAVEKKQVKIEQIKKQIQQAPVVRPPPRPVAPPQPVTQLTPTKTKPAPVPTTIKEKLQTELKQREAEVKIQTKHIQQAEEELASLEKAEQSGKPPPAPRPMPITSSPEAPKIEVTQPPISALRSIGKPRIPLANEANPTAILGKVSPAQDIDKLLINNQKTNYDSNGNFTSSINLNTSGTEVTISAINTAGKSTSLNFILVPPEKEEKEEALASTSSPLPTVATLIDSSSAASGINFGQYYALVIGNANYQNHPSLSSSVNDAEAVASSLKSRYGFKTAVLTDASRLKILDALDKFRNKLGENDNLLIYFAGHGSLEGGSGYWLPTDASTSDKSTWISNSQITNFLEAMKAKHVLVVADSCYSGTLSQLSIPRPQLDDKQKTREWYQAIASTKVRVVLSSGGVKPVLDSGRGGHSVFAAAFLDVLNAGNSLLEGFRLYEALRDQVAANARKSGISQTPQFAPIRFAGHEAGDFVMLKNGQISFNPPQQPDEQPHQPPRLPDLALLTVLGDKRLLGLKFV